jgi:hypothetical protein
MGKQPSQRDTAAGRRHLPALGCVLLVVGALAAGTAHAFPVAINTSAHSGKAATLAFDLIDGDGIANTTVTISSFSTDGTLGSASSVGGVSGSLPGVVTLSDSAFFNELLQAITLGSTVSWDLSIATSAANANPPDAFSFFLLEADGVTPLFKTTDPTGADALLVIDIGVDAAGNSVPHIFEPVLASGPGALALLAVLLPIAVFRSRHQRS